MFPTGDPPLGFSLLFLFLLFLAEVVRVPPINLVLSSGLRNPELELELILYDTKLMLWVEAGKGRKCGLSLSR
jgi:hypothetical protein